MALRPLLAAVAAPFRRVSAVPDFWRDCAAAIDARVSRHPFILDATRWPLIGWMARRRAMAVFDLCAGFVYTQVLAACVELDLFERLGPRARSVADLTADCDLPEPALQRLLDAAATLRLLRRRRDGRYGLGPLGSALVADPGIAAMVAHHRLLYADLQDPVDLLRSGAGGRALAGFWPYGPRPDATQSSSGTERYTELMAVSQTMVVRQVLSAFDLGGFDHVLDIAGGNGAFLRAVARRAAPPAMTLFDLPPVAAQARAALDESGLRVSVVGGDFTQDALPKGADLVTLIRVIHDHPDDVVRRLLVSIRESLRPGGTLLIAEPMADVAGAERVGNVYFPFYLLAMGEGRTRSVEALRSLLHDSGFEEITSKPTPLPMIASVLTAKAPQSP